jgi:hypothetical protein
MVATSGPWGVLAPSLAAYVAEADRLAPDRSRVSDGSHASAAHHEQNPASDHEAVHGVVHAVDLTNDPDGGWDGRARLDEIRWRRDPRVKYGIWHVGAEMFSSYPAHGIDAWTWRPYTGPVANEAHLSILDTPEAENDVRPWFPAATPEPEEETTMGWLLKVAGTATVWVTDTQVRSRRQISGEDELKDLLYLDTITGGRMYFTPEKGESAADHDHTDPKLYGKVRVLAAGTKWFDEVPVAG